MMGPLGRLSLDQLAQAARQEELIDRFEIAGDLVTIIQRNRTFQLPRRQASTFLIGMLRGRSWLVVDPHRRQREQKPTSEGKEGRGAAVRGDVDTGGRRLEATLEAVLPLARKLGIIKGYQVNERERTVRIDISACSSVFSFPDAARYILDCVQHEI